MVLDNTARRSESSWSSALHIVPKTDNERLAILQRLHSPQRTPPFSTAILSVISTTSLASFSVVQVSPKPILWEHTTKLPFIPTIYIRKPLPLLLAYWSSPLCPSVYERCQTSQRLMDDILRELDYCFVFLNDTLVFCGSLEKCEEHLRLSSTSFSGTGSWSIRRSVSSEHPRSPSSITRCRRRFPAAERTSGPSPRPPPSKTTNQLCRFLGMLNFYRRFLSHAIHTKAPLHSVLSGARVKGSHPINWTPDLHRAFDECKTNLLRATLLKHPDPSAPLALVTDASTSAMVAVL
jgi:hypothetical protein